MSFPGENLTITITIFNLILDLENRMNGIRDILKLFLTLSL